MTARKISPAEQAVRLRNAYVHQGQPLEVAAKTVGVSERTARRIKSRRKAEGDDWDKARAVHYQAAQSLDVISRQVLEDYLKLHQSTIEGLKNDQGIPPLAKAEALSRLADAWTKTLNAAGRLAPEIAKLALVDEILRFMVEFVKTKHPQAAPALLEVLEPLGQELSARYA